MPSPMLMRGFICLQHYPYTTGLFNHRPQSYKLGITLVGDYIFSLNVVQLKELHLGYSLRVVRQPHGLARGY